MIINLLEYIYGYKVCYLISSTQGKLVLVDEISLSINSFLYFIIIKQHNNTMQSLSSLSFLHSSLYCLLELFSKLHQWSSITKINTIQSYHCLFFFNHPSHSHNLYRLPLIYCLLSTMYVGSFQRALNIIDPYNQIQTEFLF